MGRRECGRGRKERKGRKGKKQNEGSGEEGWDYGFAQCMALGPALKKLSYLVILSRRNHRDNGVWKDFFGHACFLVSTAEVSVVAFVHEFCPCSRLKCPFVHFEFILKSRLSFPFPTLWPLNTQFLFNY